MLLQSNCKHERTVFRCTFCGLDIAVSYFFWLRLVSKAALPPLVSRHGQCLVFQKLRLIHVEGASANFLGGRGPLEICPRA